MLLRILVFVLRSVLRWMANLLRRASKAPEYVMFTLENPLPEASPPRPPFPKRLVSPKTPTLRTLGTQLRHVSSDPRVKGVVLRLYNVGGSIAQLQSLRDSLEAVHKAGKRVIVWSHSYDVGSYYVAMAADEVLLQRGGSVAPFGLESHYYFLADALERVGVQGDFVQITPYKTAPDILMRSSMSDQAREMGTWLIDDLYRQVIEGIAEGRSISTDEARDLVDGCPYSGDSAREAGAVDAILSEEELPKHLSASSKPARLCDYRSARRRLLRGPLTRPGKYVALLRIAGDIIDGRSSTPPLRPPFGLPLVLSEKAGDLTVVHQARILARNRRAAAVVVHVDSGGGSATSSEAMAAALKEVAGKKPVIVSMGTLAASGGYYVSTPGTKIVAQPGTLTGSIGVLSGKLVTAGMYEKVLFHREIISRGKHAGYYSSAQPFTDDERESLWNTINVIYEQFLRRVSESRKMSRDDVDAIGGGRVWTGAQAKDRGLVDELGSLDFAIEQAKQAAGLSSKAAVCEIRPSKRLIAPSASSAAGVLEYARRSLKLFRPGQALLLSSMVPWDGD